MIEVSLNSWKHIRTPRDMEISGGVLLEIYNAWSLYEGINQDVKIFDGCACKRSDNLWPYGGKEVWEPGNLRGFHPAPLKL